MNSALRTNQMTPGIQVNGAIGRPLRRKEDHRLLTGGLLAVAFDGDDGRGVHRAHHVGVLALPAQLHEFVSDYLNAHGELLFQEELLAMHI